ncbi:LEPR-XLL domain-containing protein [Kiritimatiellota bacterium B12222]|nr:LEPR-XLL domain-containing protein [Kiritimatiellota bacterium B12222]
MKKPTPHSLFDLEALEPRILLSADAADLLVPGASEAVQVAVTNGAEESTSPEDINLGGEQLYQVIEGKDFVVNADGVWDTDGQLLAQELAGLVLAADSVVIADGVEAENFHIDAASIYMGEVQWSGGSVLHTDELTITGSQSGTEGSSLELSPRQNDATISLGTDAVGFSLDSEALDYLSGSGIGELTIGLEEGSHAFTIDGLVYEGNLRLRAPDVGGHYNVNSTIQHSGGLLTFEGSGNTVNASADTITDSPIYYEESINLVYVENSGNIHGDNTILLDTTNSTAADPQDVNPNGHDITITKNQAGIGGNILGTGFDGGGTLYLNAGTDGTILINGDVGTTDPLDGIVIINAKSVIFNGNVLLNSFTQQAGTENTTFGNSASDTLELTTGNLDITTENNITFNGDVTLGQGSADLTVNPASAGTGKIHFKETVTLDDGDLLIQSAKNVEFTKAVDINGSITQTVGTQTTVFRGEVDADSLDIRSNSEIRFQDEVRLAEGDLTLTSNDVNFNGGTDSIIGALDNNNLPKSNVFIKPISESVSMDIGSPVGGVGTFQFTTTDIAALSDGFAHITFGYDTASRNFLRLGVADFLDPLTVYGGSFLVNGQLKAQASLSLDATGLTTGEVVGGIEVTGTQIQVSNDLVNNEWGSSVIHLLTAAGDIEIKNNASVLTFNHDEADLTQGSNIFLTATTGDILNSSVSIEGVKGRTLTATAAGGILLLTEVENFTGFSTVSGDITVNEFSDLYVTSARTQDGSITISSGGDTTLELIESLTDSDDNDISVDVYNGDLHVVEVIAGELGDVTLITEGAMTAETPQSSAHIIADELTLTAANGIGASTVPLLIQANTMNASNSTAGAVVIQQLTGRTVLSTSVINDATGSSDYISIKVNDGNTVVNATGIHSASDAGIVVDVAGNLVFDGNVSGQGGVLTLAADGSGAISGGVSLNSGGGDVGIDIGSTFSQAVDAAILSAGGHLSLVADDNIALGILDTRNALTPEDQDSWGNASVVSTTGFVQDADGSATVNIYANELTLNASTGIGVLNEVDERSLELDVALLAAVTVGGSLALKDENDLTTGTTNGFSLDTISEDGSISTANISGLTAIQNGAGDIMLSSGGLLTVTTANAVVTDGASVVALFANEMSIEGIIQSDGGDLSLSATTGDITLLDAGDLITDAKITLISQAGGVLASAGQSIDADSGSVHITTATQVTLGDINADTQVVIVSGGSVQAASGGDDSRNVITSAAVAITAAMGIDGPVGSGEALLTTSSKMAVNGTGDTPYRIENTGDLSLEDISGVGILYTPLLSSTTANFTQVGGFKTSGEGDLELIVNGNLDLSTNREISTTGAGNIQLTTTAAFTMAETSLLANENGSMDVDAQNTVAVSEVRSTDGDITVSSATGSIIDSDPAEAPVDFSTLGQLDLTAATGVGIEAGERQTLNVILGTLSAETATGGIFVSSTAGFATNGLITTADTTPVSITSGGDLVVGGNLAGVAVNATGSVVLLADGHLTQVADSTIASATDIRLSSGATMTLVEVSTPGDVAVTAVDLIGLPATTATEISANGLYLDQVGSLGSSAQPMRFAVARLAGTVNDGVMAFENTGDLALGLVSVETIPTTPMGVLPGLSTIQTGDRLVVDGVGEGLFANITGALTVDAGADAALTVSEAIPVLWQSTGTQTWNDSFSVNGGNVTLRTNADLAFATGGTSQTQGGDVSFEVGQDLTLSSTSSIDTAAGSLLARVGDNLLLNGGIISTANVGLIAGTDITVTAIGGPVTRVIAQNLVLNARVKIAAGLFPLTTQVDNLTAISGASGVYVANTGDLQITNLGFSVASLHTDASVDVAFSGHQGGVSTTQAGAISVNSTGTMTVQEVAAVIEAFPDTLNAISIVADHVGPAGNALNIVFDIKTSGAEGNPPTTVFTPGNNLLTVTLRKDVSTLQEIVDAINANVDFEATAVLAEGPMDGSQVFTLASNEDFAFFAEGGRREGVLVGASAVFTGGLEPIASISQILLPGEAFHILFTSLNPGVAANSFEVSLLDDGPGGHLTDGANEAFIDWDEPNGKLNIFINYGVTTIGTLLTAVTDANTNDALPFSAELAGSFVNDDYNTALGDPSVTLVSNLSSSADLRPIGTHNDITITATVSGQLYNQIETVFVDDGSISGSGASASFDGFTNLLTVFINSGSSTANQVISAINSEGTFSAALLQENTGGSNNGNGVIQASVFKTHSGAELVHAVAHLDMVGTNNNLVLTANDAGADENGIEIRLIRDESISVGDVNAVYDEGARILTVKFSSYASAGNVRDAINTAKVSEAPMAALANLDLIASLAPGNNGFGSMVLATYPLTAGGTGGPPEVVFTATGANNDFTLVADSTSPSLEGIEVFLIDDGSITDGSATAVYDATPRHLVLNVQSGVTTLTTLLSVLNADGTIPVSGALVAGNDGSGVFNLPAQPFIGGADPVKALATTELPSGVEIILEAEDGGIAQNGIQVVYAINPSLAVGTAAASFFEVDDVRLLQIQVQSSSTTINAMELALDSAGLPFTIANLADIGTLTPGALALRATGVQEGNLRLTAENDISLVGRVQSETGGVSVTTQNGSGNLTFDSETAHIVAISNASISLDGSFANLLSTEMPLVKVYADGVLSILADENLVESELPVLLQGGGDITIGGDGGMTLNDQDLDVDAGGDITLSAPVDAGTGDVTLDAGEGITVTVDGSISGESLSLTAVDDIDQNGNLTATGTGTIDVTSTAGSITMGADAETSSDTGDITYTAEGNVGITSMASTSGNIDVVATTGAITDTHASNGTNLATAGVTTLTAQTGIGAILTGDLKTQVGELQLRNLGASGDIVITEQAADGDLTITELTQDAVSGWSIVNVDNGSLTLSGPVTHSSDGSLVMGVNGDLLVQDEINLNGGNFSAGIFGNTTFEMDINTQGGDVGVAASGSLSMNAAMTLDADGGNVLLQAMGNVLISHVLSPDADVRIESTSGSVLRAANDGSTSVTTGTLQVDAALSVGSLTAANEAFITDVARLNASAGVGDLAVNELDALIIGNSSVSVKFAQVDKSTVSGTWNESQLTNGDGNTVLQVGDALTVELSVTDPTIAVNGNFHLSTGGTLTLNGDSEITNGSAQITSTLDTLLIGNLDVSGGTLLMQSGGVFTQDPASVITVSDDHAALNAVGAMTLSRVDTGTGDLSLMTDGDLLVDAAAPALQLTSSGLRLHSGGAIGSVAHPIALTADTLSALAVNDIQLDVTGDVDVTAVGVTVDTVNILGVTTDPAFVKADQADIVSTTAGNILMSVSGALDLNDGDADGSVVSTQGAGKIFISANSLNAYADVSSEDGAISLIIAAAANWITTPESAPSAGDGIAAKVLSSNGDLQVVVGAALTMDDQTQFKTDNGDIRVETTNDFVIASVQAVNGLVALDVGEKLLDNGDTDTDVIADELQILSGTGIGILSPYNAIDIDVNLLAVQVTTGSMVLNELSAVEIGEVSGAVALLDIAGVETSTVVNPVYGLQSLGGGSVSMTSAGNLTVLTGGDPLDAEYGVYLTGSGNLFLQSSATNAVLTLNDSIMAGSGHLTLRGNGGMVLATDVFVESSGVGSLSLFSSNGGITQAAGSELIAENGDIVLKAKNTISLAQITTNLQVSVTSDTAAILDNNAGDLNISATSLRLKAGTNIATGNNHLEIDVSTLSAATTNGAMYVTESTALDIGSTQASTQVVQMDGSVVATPVTAQSGLKSGGSVGTIVVENVTGEINVLAGHEISASQAGNILINSADVLDVDADISSGSGSITLQSVGSFELATEIEVRTGGAGQLHVFSTSTVMAEAESRFIAGTGNVAIAAASGIKLGGITTSGKVAIGTLVGYILGAGSTTFDQEVIGSQLLLSALNGGVGTLTPVSPISAFRTRVGRIAGEAGAGGMNVVNEIGLTVDVVDITIQRVITDGSLQAMPNETLSDLSTNSNGSIVLRASSGSVVLADGADSDGIAVSADGSGNVRVYAAQDITANADVESASGHVTLRAFGALNVNADITTASTGTVYLRAESAALTMLGTATVSAENSSLFLQGSGDVTLGNLVGTSAAVTSTNGQVINAAGSTLNFEGTFLRLQSQSNIGTGINPLTVTASFVSAVSSSGGIYLQATGDIGVSSNAVVVQEVQNDATTSSVTAASLSGIKTLGSNGPIVLVSLAGSVTISDVVSAHGSGNILLDGDTQVTISQDVSSGTGHISLIAGNGVDLTANVDVTTTGSGSVFVDAGSGSISMNQTATISAPGASLRLLADGNIQVATLTATNSSLISTSGEISKVAGTGVNVSTSGLRISAAQSIGSAASHLRIAAATLSASSATGDIFLTESDNVTVTGVTVTTSQVGSTAATTSVIDASQPDLTTGLNGDIVLVTLAGSITLNDGGDEDFLAVEANGTGSIRLEAPVNVAVNSGISSGTGHITVVAGDNIAAGVGVVTISTATAGTISLRAGGAVSMTGLTQVQAMDSSLRISGDGDVTLGTLTAAEVSILSTSGSVFNATGTIRNVTATELRIVAANGLGTAARRLTTAVSTLSGSAGAGGIFITELDALTIGEVEVSVTEFTANAGTTVLTDAALSDLRATAGGDVVLTTGDTLTLGTIAGDIVNLFSATDILNNTVSTPNVEATALLLNATGDIGTVLVPLVTDVELLSAHSTSGDIFIADTGDVEVGAVDNLATPGNAADQQSDIVTDTANTVLMGAQGNLTLGRITSGTVALLAGNQVLKTVGSTLNVDASALRIEATNGVGEIGHYLITRVDTLAAVSTNGDILLSDNEGLEIGSVTVTGMATGDVLTGIQTLVSGDVVILSDDFLTVDEPISVVGNVRLSAEGVLDLGTITATDVSLLTTSTITQTSGLITATNLRVNAEGDIGTLGSPLASQVDALSVVSETGTVFVREADDAALGSIAVTAGGVTDASQHGVASPLGVTLMSLAGRFLDGGDAEADIRTAAVATVTTLTGLGSTGSGGIEVDAAELTVDSQGDGNVFVNLQSATTLSGLTLSGHGYLYLNALGDVTLTAPISLTASSGAYLTIAGITDLQADISVGRDLRITTASMLMSDAVVVTSATGNVQVRTLTTLVMGEASVIEATTGRVQLQSGTDMTVGLLHGAVGVDLQAGGNIDAVSTSRATHEIKGAAVRLSADGAILPVLTDADRLDVDAGAVTEIYELDDLVVGRYGLRLINESTGDTLTLKMNEAELTSYNGVAVVPGVGTFVWISDAAVTLGTRLVTDNGSIRIEVDSLQQSGSITDPYVNAENGEVSIEVESGAGTVNTNPITIAADEFTASSTTGSQAYQVEGDVTVDGITTTSGSGKIQLIVDNGNLIQTGRLVHSGTGMIDVQVSDGLLNVQGAGLGNVPLMQSGGSIGLLLDTGISLSGVSRLVLQGARFSAITRTGNLTLELRAPNNVQSFLDNFRISEGTGSINITSPHALVVFGLVENYASGNLSMQAGSYISMEASNSLIRSTNGVLTLKAQELELARIISTGSSTILRATLLGIKVKPGYSGTNITSDHAVVAYINTTIANLLLNNTLNIYDVDTSAFLTSYAGGTPINYTAP